MLGVLVSGGALVFWFVPDLPTEPRMPMSVFGPLLLLLGSLAWRHHQPAEERSLRLGVTLYLLLATVLTLMGLSQRFGPDPLALPAASSAASAASAHALGSLRAVQHRLCRPLCRPGRGLRRGPLARQCRQCRKRETAQDT